MTMQRNHILKGSGTTAPGIKPVLLVAPYDWLDVEAIPSNTEDGTGSLITITDNHTFQTASPSYGFIKFELADRTGEVNFEMTGEPENESTIATAMGYHPGVNKLLLSYFGRTFQGIILAQDSSCSANMYYQIGAGCTLARPEGWKFGTGKNGGNDRKGVELKFSAYQETPLIYLGAVTLAEQPVVS